MIRGERVVLRPVEETDHAAIRAWQNHPEVWFWMDHERPFSLEWHDRVVMSVTREEFEALQRSGFQRSFTPRS